MANGTGDMIKEMLSPDDVSSETSVVLINAIYFSGFWEAPFNNRELRVFHSIPEREIQMMSKSVKAEDEWNFQSSKDWEALGIPYKNRKAWMYIVLPRKRHGLKEVIKKFDYNMFLQCTKRLGIQMFG